MRIDIALPPNDAALLPTIDAALRPSRDRQGAVTPDDAAARTTAPSRSRLGIERWWLAVAVAALAVSTVGCRQDMQDQPKYIPLRPSEFFSDGRSERPLVEDTVARGQLHDDAAFYTGKGPDGKFLDTFPFPVTRAVLDRGQERFNIYCSPCHGRLGDGDGKIVRRGFRHPPSYHIDRLRQAPAGHFFDVITNGLGAMPDYAAQIAPSDRWAIVAYVRALELSQDATLNDVPAEARLQLQQGGGQ